MIAAKTSDLSISSLSFASYLSFKGSAGVVVSSTTSVTVMVTSMESLRPPESLAVTVTE